jgi:hypothetical protein
MVGTWIKNHKLVVLLLLIIGFILWKNNNPIPLSSNSSFQLRDAASSKIAVGSGMGAAPMPLIAQDSYAPTTETTNRMVIQNSYLSLLVDNVKNTTKQILTYTTSQGGYMVNSSIDNPNDTPTATVTIRIPSKNLDTILEYFRSLSIKVVSENLTGDDVTDQYTDLNARLATLNATKAKFQDIFNQAVKIQDILDVQRELINVQSQIDAVKGQQLYLSKSAEMAKVTLYLSTDEIALPYAPSETWRPNVIFKLAVRSLISHAREIGTGLIWIAVYSVIWIPLLIIGFILKKKLDKK